jgi:hypothetical protein
MYFENEVTLMATTVWSKSVRQRKLCTWNELILAQIK